MAVERRDLLKGTASIAAAMGIAGCTGALGGQSQTTTTKLGMTLYPVIPHGLPVTVALDQGLYEENGVNVDEVISTIGGGEGVRQMTTGEIGAGMQSPQGTVRAFLAGAPLYMVGLATAKPVVDWETLPDSDIETIQDCAGKKICPANKASATEANAILSIAAADGITLDDVEFVYARGLQESIALLNEGVVDVTMNTPPLSTGMLANNEVRRVWHTRDYVPNWTEDILVMSDISIQDQEMSSSLIQAWLDGAEFIKQNPEESGRIWAEAADLSESIAIQAVKDVNPEEFYNIEIPEEFGQNFENVLQIQGLIGEDEEFNFGEFIRQEPLPEEQRAGWI